MSARAERVQHPDEPLLKLLGKIAARDTHESMRLLGSSPALASQTVAIGATRADSHPYFFRDIAHYAYAGDTSLHFAAAAYETELARALIARGAEVRARNRRGAEPLHYACDGGPGSTWWNADAQFGVVDFLIRAGAEPRAVDASGVAPLHRAVRNRCTGAVRALLLSGADARATNRTGSTPLHLAMLNTGRSGSGTAEAREQQAEIIRLLLAHGAEPADRVHKG